MRKPLGIGALAGAAAAILLRNRLRRLAGHAERVGRALGARRYGMTMPNDELRRRVEHALGSQDGAIAVDASSGVVRLRGEAESQEMIDDLVARTRRVDGVEDVDNQLHLRQQ